MIETFIKALSEKCLQANSQSARKTAINITSNTIYIRILTYYITLHLTKNFGVVQQSRQAKFNIYTPPTLAGFSFVLHLLRVQGFLFCPATIQPNTSVYSVFCTVHAVYSPRRKTALRALQVHFQLFVPFYRRRHKTDISSYNTTCTTLEHITAPGRPPAHTRYHRRAGRCTGQHSRLL